MKPVPGPNAPLVQRVSCIVLGLTLGFAHAVYAQRNPDIGGPKKEFLSSPEKGWSESEGIAFPDVPQQQDLVALDSRSIDSRYSYFIAPESVSLGSDGVLRYALVLESKSGARNTVYEGIRCETSEFKTYAYATHAGQFKPLPSSEWRKLRTTGPNDYRRLLAERYLCDRDILPLKEEEVRKRISNDNPARTKLRPELKDYLPLGK